MNRNIRFDIYFLRKNNIINLLGIQENLIKKFKRDENSIELYIQTKSHICLSCGQATMHVHDYRNQRIQHINIGKLTSFLILRKRRYICIHCGKRFYENYDFIQRYFRKSNELYPNIISDLKNLKNYTTISNYNNVLIPTVVRYSKYFAFLSCKKTSIFYYLYRKNGSVSKITSVYTYSNQFLKFSPQLLTKSP